MLRDLFQLCYVLHSTASLLLSTGHPNLLWLQAWSISANTQQQHARVRANGSNSSVSLTARPVMLKELRNSSFVDVCMAPCQPAQPHGSNGVYALVGAGVLVLMRPTGRTIDKSVNLQVCASWSNTDMCRFGSSKLQVVLTCDCFGLTISAVSAPCCRCHQLLHWQLPPLW